MGIKLFNSKAFLLTIAAIQLIAFLYIVFSQQGFSNKTIVIIFLGLTLFTTILKLFFTRKKASNKL